MVLAVLDDEDAVLAALSDAVTDGQARRAAADDDVVVLIGDGVGLTHDVGVGGDGGPGDGRGGRHEGQEAFGEHGFRCGLLLFLGK